MLINVICTELWQRFKLSGRTFHAQSEMLGFSIRSKPLLFLNPSHLEKTCNFSDEPIEIELIVHRTFETNGKKIVLNNFDVRIKPRDILHSMHFQTNSELRQEEI